jgi:hypothetical protein
MRKLITNVLAASALLFATATFAQDRTGMDTDRAVGANTTNTVDANDDTGFNPGWFGLAGLIGLLGLMPRDNDHNRFGRSSTTGTTTDIHR